MWNLNGNNLKRDDKMLRFCPSIHPSIHYFIHCNNWWQQFHAGVGSLKLIICRQQWTLKPDEREQLELEGSCKSWGLVCFQRVLVSARAFLSDSRPLNIRLPPALGNGSFHSFARFGCHRFASQNHGRTFSSNCLGVPPPMPQALQTIPSKSRQFCPVFNNFRNHQIQGVLSLLM